MSAEATVVRTYIDTLLEVPWSKRTKINLDLTKAKEALDIMNKNSHFGKIILFTDEFTNKDNKVN